MRTKSTLVVLLVLVSVLRASAQTPRPADPRSTAERLYQFRITTIGATAAARDSQIEILADVLGQSLDKFVYYAIPPAVLTDSFKDFLHTANKARVDQQLGSSVSSATSAVARTGVSTLFDAALETGAISQTVDQNVVTVRTNADGLARFLSNQDVFTPCPPADHDCASATWLKNLDGSASFTASDGGTQAMTGKTASGATAGFTAPFNKQQFVSATARYSVMNDRDLRSDAYRKKWLAWFSANKATLESAGAELLTYADKVINKIQKTPGANNRDEYTNWVEDTKTALRAATPTIEKWQETYATRLDLLIGLMRKADPEFETNMAEASRAFARYFALRRDLLSTIITSPGLTLEFTYAEPQAQPALNAVRVAYAYSPKGPRGTANPGTITFNGALEWYRDPQTVAAGQSARFRDAQAALQFDRPLGPADSAGQLSIGVYYQYQVNPGIIVVPTGATVLPNTNIPLPAAGSTLLGEQGSIVAAQATLTLRLAGGLKVPIGFSWANRTELVTGSQVRGHIGISFDTAPLFLLTGLRQ